MWRGKTCPHNSAIAEAFGRANPPADHGTDLLDKTHSVGEGAP